MSKSKIDKLKNYIVEFNKSDEWTDKLFSSGLVISEIDNQVKQSFWAVIWRLLDPNLPPGIHKITLEFIINLLTTNNETDEILYLINNAIVPFQLLFNYATSNIKVIVLSIYEKFIIQYVSDLKRNALNILLPIITCAENPNSNEYLTLLPFFEMCRTKWGSSFYMKKLTKIATCSGDLAAAVSFEILRVFSDDSIIAEEKIAYLKNIHEIISYRLPQINDRDNYIVLVRNILECLLITSESLTSKNHNNVIFKQLLEFMLLFFILNDSSVNARLITLFSSFNENTTLTIIESFILIDADNKFYLANNPINIFKALKEEAHEETMTTHIYKALDSLVSKKYNYFPLQHCLIMFDYWTKIDPEFSYESNFKFIDYLVDQLKYVNLSFINTYSPFIYKLILYTSPTIIWADHYNALVYCLFSGLANSDWKTVYYVYEKSKIDLHAFLSQNSEFLTLATVNITPTEEFKTNMNFFLLNLDLKTIAEYVFKNDFLWQYCHIIPEFKQDIIDKLLSNWVYSVKTYIDYEFFLNNVEEFNLRLISQKELHTINVLICYTNYLTNLLHDYKDSNVNVYSISVEVFSVILETISCNALKYTNLNYLNFITDIFLENEMQMDFLKHYFSLSSEKFIPYIYSILKNLPSELIKCVIASSEDLINGLLTSYLGIFNDHVARIANYPLDQQNSDISKHRLDLEKRCEIILNIFYLVSIEEHSFHIFKQYSAIHTRLVYSEYVILIQLLLFNNHINYLIKGESREHGPNKTKECSECKGQKFSDFFIFMISNFIEDLARANSSSVIIANFTSQHLFSVLSLLREIFINLVKYSYTGKSKLVKLLCTWLINMAGDTEYSTFQTNTKQIYDSIISFQINLLHSINKTKIKKATDVHCDKKHDKDELINEVSIDYTMLTTLWANQNFEKNRRFVDLIHTTLKMYTQNFFNTIIRNSYIENTDVYVKLFKNALPLEKQNIDYLFNLVYKTEGQYISYAIDFYKRFCSTLPTKPDYKIVLSQYEKICSISYTVEHISVVKLLLYIMELIEDTNCDDMHILDHVSVKTLKRSVDSIVNLSMFAFIGKNNELDNQFLYSHTLISINKLLTKYKLVKICSMLVKNELYLRTLVKHRQLKIALSLVDLFLDERINNIRNIKNLLLQFDQDYNKVFMSKYNNLYSHYKNFLKEEKKSTTTVTIEDNASDTSITDSIACELQSTDGLESKMNKKGTGSVLRSVRPTNNSINLSEIEIYVKDFYELTVKKKLYCTTKSFEGYQKATIEQLTLNLLGDFINFYPYPSRLWNITAQATAPDFCKLVNNLRELILILLGSNNESLKLILESLQLFLHNIITDCLIDHPKDLQESSNFIASLNLILTIYFICFIKFESISMNYFYDFRIFVEKVCSYEYCGQNLDLKLSFYNLYYTLSQLGNHIHVLSVLEDFFLNLKNINNMLTSLDFNNKYIIWAHLAINNFFK